MKFYSGIGSRQCPPEILDKFRKLAKILESLGYTLRTGDASGADEAFRCSVVNKIVYKSKDAKDWAFDLVKKCMPEDREGFDYYKPYVKGLLARDMMQILGDDGKTPSEFVLCWTPSVEYKTSLCGGTGYAIRCALDHQIPVFNLKNKEDLENIKKHIKNNSLLIKNT